MLRPFGHRKAFTLIEVLGAAAIVAILLALLFPVFGVMRVSAQKADTIVKMRQLHTAFLGFAADRDGQIPPAYSSGKDEYGKTYGTWSHYLNAGGHIRPRRTKGKILASTASISSTNSHQRTATFAPLP